MIRTALIKPVLILQNMDLDSPAYLATWLQEGGIAYELRNSEAGQSIPETLTDYSALAVLGGAMSANDELPSLRQAERLILEGLAVGIPVIGHCLGGQLVAKALGARVSASPAPEIGWHPITPVPSGVKDDWFGPEPLPEVFHWHYEAFDLPPGAQLLASSPACPHQAFAIGPHLAMQFHVELDAPKLQVWTAHPDPDHESARRTHSTVHSFVEMHRHADMRLRLQQRLADRIYRRWWSAVAER
jgi:GMP synthase-like glutamine amidotransferase